MENFTNEQIKAAAKFYEEMGVSIGDYISGGKIKDIFNFLQIKPQVDDDGNRKLTPYEILGLLPNVENGKEKPIVFVVKNKFRAIRPFRSQVVASFDYKKSKSESEDALISFVVKSYRSAIAQNNLAEAERQLDVLNKITGGKAKRYLGEFYDYTRFYRQMKKQLLIDLFSHFFLVYLMRKKSLIKKGLIIKNKKFVPYKQDKDEMLAAAEMLPEIKSIRIDEVPEGSEKVEALPVEEPQSQEKNEKSDAKPEPQKQQSAPVQRKSFIKKLKNRFFRKDKKKLNAIRPGAVEFKPQPENLEKEVSYE